LSGSDIWLDVRELEKISQAFARARELGNIKKLLHSIGTEEEGQIKERFETKKDPDGNSWTSWSKNYSKGKSLLVKSGRLKSSIQFNLTSFGVVWGSNLIYAGTHQNGFDKKGVPARPYLGFGEEDLFLLNATIEDFITQSGGGMF